MPDRRVLQFDPSPQRKRGNAFCPRLRFGLRWRLLALSCFCVAAAGCGTTKSRLATEQLLMSDAVDAAVEDIDFQSLSGEKVYFDTKYIANIKGIGFVNSEYIISSLRQQMMAADCRLQDQPAEADYIVEARVGALGTNSHEIVYGVPANNSLSAAASVVPDVPPIPTLPEISLARKDSNLGAAKLAVFAYERVSKRPVWQSGISKAKSHAQDYWIFGAGPFQRGEVYDGTQFAGNRLPNPLRQEKNSDAAGAPIAYKEQYHFPRKLIPEPRDLDPVSVVGFQAELPPSSIPPTEPPPFEPAPAAMAIPAPIIDAPRPSAAPEAAPAPPLPEGT